MVTTPAASAEARPVDGVEVARSHPDSPPPIVSVIVSTRNHAAWLQRTVDAVMGQAIDATLEMIVVDNASTDQTADVMRAAIRSATRPLTYARLPADRAPAGGRNAGIELARGQFLAFTDSDCTPSPGWLRAALAAFDSPAVGIVQGCTRGAGSAQPFFSHYIETDHLDGSFSTSNVVYRREAVGEMRFDPTRTYWEDVDLGWRVVQAGWSASFAAGALVEHEVVPLSPRQWLLWPRRYSNWPAKAARYPGFRKYLVLGVWVSPIHAWFDLALLGVAAAPWAPPALLLVCPYVVEFARKRGLRGKFPPAKAAAHVAWDFVALGVLLAGSVRYRRLVL
jgi:cellulose synthase/poly-beta-1,6-N-acetylglucosamine synthase-like glycosyltransferase